MNDIIQMENVSFRYAGQHADVLKNIQLTIKPGECIIFCGKSGSGKSTLLKLINGLSPQYIEGELSGIVRINGLNPASNQINDFVSEVGSVFQNPKTQHFTENTIQELAFPLENIGYSPQMINQKIEEISENLHLKDLLDHPIFHLSGGQKQQIALASALMLSPKILVLDEVTSNLDQYHIDLLVKRLLELKQLGLTIIMAEHRLKWALELVDRYFYLDKGEIKEEWTSETIDELSPQKIKRLGLRLSGSKNKGDCEKFEHSPNTNSSAFFQINHLSIGYQNDIIQHDLNLSFYDGEIIGIMGANGIGKSTLAKTLIGLLPKLAGQIIFDGREMTAKNLRKIGFLVMQDSNYQLFSHMVLSELLIDSNETQKAEDILKQLGLYEYRYHHPMSLSEGQKQRVAIASALMSDKKIIIFDEPSSGMDGYHLAQFKELLIQLKVPGQIIIVMTHDRDLAENCFDQIHHVK